QPGNNGKRIWRFPSKEKNNAIVNRMGLPNNGIEHVERRIQQYAAKHHERPFVLAVNITTGTHVANTTEAITKELAAMAQHPSYQRLAQHVDALVWNASCPNREHNHDQGTNPENQTSDAITAQIQIAAQTLRAIGFQKIFVKIAPDLDNDQIKQIAEIAQEGVVDGIVACNTMPTHSINQIQGNADTIAKRMKRNPKIMGGISGCPLQSRAIEVQKMIAASFENHKRNSKNSPNAPVNTPLLIASGGVMTPEDVVARLDNGADIVQCYTGLVFDPWLVKKSNQLLAAAKSQAEPTVAERQLLHAQ
ncbi:MAG: hypothetical protein K0U36_00305, partial [Alphaproteobacteria bacterium]|nr:hypothetical protein [Alphaproteobacteria bacterium]